MIASKKSEVKTPDITDTPSQKFGLDSYQWVSQGSSLTTTQADLNKNDYTLQLQTKWLGAALSVVEEFYSSDNSKRWKFGEM